MGNSENPFAKLLTSMRDGAGGRQRAEQWLRTARANYQADGRMGRLPPAEVEETLRLLDEAEAAVLGPSTSR